MATRLNPISQAANPLRRQLAKALSLQAEQIEQLQRSLHLIQARHRQIQQSMRPMLECLALPSGDTGGPLPTSLEGILAAVRDLLKATCAAQVFKVLAEKAAEMKARCAIFEVRGNAAWGGLARGFEPGLSDSELRSLVVSLNQDGPFRQVYETAAAVAICPRELSAHCNLLETFKPDRSGDVHLLPILSVGSVTAILYVDSAHDTPPPCVRALAILTEFAGAQLDRLVPLCGGREAAPSEQTPTTEPAAAAEAEGATVESEAPTVQPESVAVPDDPGSSTTEVGTSGANREVTSEASAAPPEAGTAQPESEEDQRTHRDARRFSKLLVTEIVLYNKAEVEEGRENKDLYLRLKFDIDRSRQTYEKRFGNTVAKQADHFHDELVRTLASNDPTLLGPDYPGASI